MEKYWQALSYAWFEVFQEVQVFNPLNAGYFSKNRLYCRLLYKTFKLCLFFMGNDGLSSKQVGSQANAVPALKGLKLKLSA